MVNSLKTLLIPIAAASLFSLADAKSYSLTLFYPNSVQNCEGTAYRFYGTVSSSECPSQPDCSTICTTIADSETDYDKVVDDLIRQKGLNKDYLITSSYTANDCSVIKTEGTRFGFFTMEDSCFDTMQGPVPFSKTVQTLSMSLTAGGVKECYDSKCTNCKDRPVGVCTAEAAMSRYEKLAYKKALGKSGNGAGSKSSAESVVAHVALGFVAGLGAVLLS